MSTLGLRYHQNYSKRKVVYCERFGIVFESKKGTLFTETLMNQLDTCADDEARRLILGISEKVEGEC